MTIGVVYRYEWLPVTWVYGRLVQSQGSSSHGLPPMSRKQGRSPHEDIHNGTMAWPTQSSTHRAVKGGRGPREVNVCVVAVRAVHAGEGDEAGA